MFQECAAATAAALHALQGCVSRTVAALSWLEQPDPEEGEYIADPASALKNCDLITRTEDGRVVALERAPAPGGNAPIKARQEATPSE